jgi:hypothetical protein
MPLVLFINPNFEDYASDGVFHGLRTMLGADAVDFPKAEYLYDTWTDGVRARVRGGGFTLYGLLPDLPVDRDHVLPRALDGEFDLVVFGDIWRTFGLWTEWGPQLHRAGVPLAVLDGADRVEPYPYSGLWWRVKGWWFLPRVHRRATYFKREVTPWTYWFATYLILPPPLGRASGRLRGLRPLAFAIPEEKIVTTPASKDKDFPKHVVDEELAGQVGGQTEYAFTDEPSYVADLRRSRFGVTTKRAGWDSLRNYEIAAAGALPCFRDLHRKPPTCAPFGLDEGNCLTYRNAEDLLRQVRQLDDRRYTELQAGALAWARANTTTVRARELLATCGLEAP